MTTWPSVIGGLLRAVGRVWNTWAPEAPGGMAEALEADLKAWKAQVAKDIAAKDAQLNEFDKNVHAAGINKHISPAAIGAVQALMKKTNQEILAAKYSEFQPDAEAWWKSPGPTDAIGSKGMAVLKQMQDAIDQDMMTGGSVKGGDTAPSILVPGEFVFAGGGGGGTSVIIASGWVNGGGGGGDGFAIGGGGWEIGGGGAGGGTLPSTGQHVAPWAFGVPEAPRKVPAEPRVEPVPGVREIDLED